MACVLVALLGVAGGLRETSLATAAVATEQRAALSATVDLVFAAAVSGDDASSLVRWLDAARATDRDGAGWRRVDVAIDGIPVLAWGEPNGEGWRSGERSAALPDGRTVRVVVWVDGGVRAPFDGRTALVWAALGLPLALAAWLALGRGPSRTLRQLRGFIERCAEAPHDDVAMAVEGHATEFHDLIRAANAAKGRLAEQQRGLGQVSDEARRFAGAARNTSVGLLLTDRHGTIEWANDGFERLTGHAVASVIGRRPREVLDSIGAAPDTLSVMAARSAAGEAFSADLLVRPPDGTRRWVHVDAEPVRDDGGDLVGFVSFHTDAEERIRAVDGLRRGQEILRAVAHGAELLLRAPAWHDVIEQVIAGLGQASGARRAFVYRAETPPFAALCAAWPGDREPSFAAPSAPERCALGAWSEELSCGRAVTLDDDRIAFADLTPWGRGLCSVTMAPVAVAGRWWGFVALEASPGAAVWTEVDRLALRAAADAISAAIERYEGEAALARQRSFADEVLQGIQQGVAVTDAEGRVTYANPALLAMLGRAVEQVVGRHIVDFGDERRADDVAGDGWPGRAFELVVPARGGHRRLLVIPSHGASAEGVGRVVVVTDVTERSRMEAALRRTAAQAEAANDAKSRFLARVSHELRTPLNAIVGFAQLAAMDAETPDMSESLQQIRGAGRHLGTLIDELIDLAAAETGDLKVAFERIDLAEIAQQALRLVAPLAEAAGLHVVRQVEPSVMVIADPRRATQVALNLLGNAVKYNQPGGRLTLRVTHDAGEGWARLMVEDTGPGIDEAEMARLFRPFERLSSAGERGGSGIGLALSHVLAERMGGRLRAESRIGRGSRFWLELPLAPPVGEPAPVVDSPS